MPDPTLKCTEEFFARAIAHVETGRTLNGFLEEWKEKDPGHTPSSVSFYAAIKRREGWAERWQEAMESQSHNAVDSIIEDLSDSSHDAEEWSPYRTSRLRARAEQIRWTAEKRNSAVYGRRDRLEVSGQIDHRLTVSAADVLAARRTIKRVTEASGPEAGAAALLSGGADVGTRKPIELTPEALAAEVRMDEATPLVPDSAQIAAERAAAGYVEPEPME